MRIAVLGGGNGSFAAAGDFALAGHDVRLWRRDREAVEAHRAAGGVIAIKDFRGRHEARPLAFGSWIGRTSGVPPSIPMYARDASSKSVPTVISSLVPSGVHDGQFPLVS